jgi:hypothetical protein
MSVSMKKVSTKKKEKKIEKRETAATKNKDKQS